MSEILRAALIGIGAMGRGHLGNYLRFTEEGKLIKLVAVCDIDNERFAQKDGTLNIPGVDAGGFDFGAMNCYTDVDEMLDKENLDLVSVVIPTYEHCEITCKCLDRGINVFCEKPMALNVADCKRMIEASERSGKRLMIGQCLRFWDEYNVVKEYVDNGKLGRCTSGYFFRGGEPPRGSYKDWYLKKDLCGGAIRDQHIHDVDIIQYIFGMPKAVHTLARNVIPGSGYDTVSTNYIYDDMKAVNAQNDWTIQGVGFMMSFRVGFEGGTIYMDQSGFRVCPKDGEPFTPELPHESAYYSEIKYFAECILEGKPNQVNPPEDSMNTIKIVEREIESAENGGTVALL